MPSALNFPVPSNTEPPLQLWTGVSGISEGGLWGACVSLHWPLLDRCSGPETRFGEWGEGRFPNGLQQSKAAQGVLLFFFPVWGLLVKHLPVLICHFSEEKMWVDVIAEELLSPFYGWRRGCAEYRQVMAQRCRSRAWGSHRRCLGSSSTAQLLYRQYLTHGCPSVLPTKVSAGMSQWPLSPVAEGCTLFSAQRLVHRSQLGLANLNSLMLPMTLEWWGTCMTITPWMAFLLLVWHSQYGQAQKWSLILLRGLVWTVTWAGYHIQINLGQVDTLEPSITSLSLPNYMN